MDNLDDGTIFGTRLDARYSGDDLKALLLRFPDVIAMVNGHTHANRIIPHRSQAPSPVSSAFWEISTASHIDWPIQSRIIEIAASPDARNGGFGGAVGPGTISIFTTMVDPAAPLAYGGDLSNPSQLASLARELATNDPQEVAVKPDTPASNSAWASQRTATPSSSWPPPSACSRRARKALRSPSPATRTDGWSSSAPTRPATCGTPASAPPAATCWPGRSS